MLRRQAAKLLAGLQSNRDPLIELKVQRWRQADPRNAAAFDRVQRSYEQAGLLTRSGIRLPSEYEPATRKPAWRPRPALAAAAAILLILPFGMLLLGRAGSPLGSPDLIMLMTSVGEIRQFDLAGGSKVTLDTATKVDVEIGRYGRSARLRYGRARFEVAQAEESFVVQTDSGTISMGQGVLDIEKSGGQARVNVLAGRADVRGSNQAASSDLMLRAGEGATVASGRVELEKGVGPRSDWTRGMLQFDDTPLYEVAALANRYSTQRIIVAGEIGALRVTGAFRAGDTLGLAKALMTAFNLSLHRDGNGDLVLARGARPGAYKRKGG